ncbi:hypothetical protein Y1Q_0020542 [Alligator mississippiensis]|uniref:Uncharacterized protein n=1 Tax=Alligator mississippiensis TaxID=8496 RepID=A0A151P3X4_ALLMI|nr:hypothetical protein Y1Q_0020542 [Alligator mississippiensis]
MPRNEKHVAPVSAACGFPAVLFEEKSSRCWARSRCKSSSDGSRSDQRNIRRRDLSQRPLFLGDVLLKEPACAVESS